MRRESPLREEPLRERKVFFPGWAVSGPSALMRDLSPLQGPLRDRLTGRPLTGRLLTGRLGLHRKPLTRRDGPYGKGRSLQEPLRADRLTGRPLTGRLLTRRPLTNYRKTYGKLRGGTLPELGGNFRLCAVDQKRPFFPRAGRGPVRVLHREGRRRGLRGGPLQGGFLQEGPLRITGKLTGSYGEGFYQNWAGISACVP